MENLCIKKKNELCLYEEIDPKVCKYCYLPKGYPRFMCKPLNLVSEAKETIKIILGGSQYY